MLLLNRMSPKRLWMNNYYRFYHFCLSVLLKIAYPPDFVTSTIFTVFQVGIFWHFPGQKIGVVSKVPTHAFAFADSFM